MKLVSEAELSSLFEGLPANPRCVVSGNFGTPYTLLDLFDKHVAAYRLHMLLAQRGIPDRPGVEYETTFVGPGMRNHPRLRYFPCRLSLVPALLSGPLIPNVVLIHTTPRQGDFVSLGVETNVLPAAIESVKRNGGIVVAQTNRAMPYTYGDSEVDCRLIDYHFEVEESIVSPEVHPLSEVERRIGDLVSREVPDGATIQIGIGAIPDAVLDALVTRRGLGIWTEVFSDGVLHLFRSGALDDLQPIHTSFVSGSYELYEWVNHNRRIRMRRTETSNNPGIIASQRMMTSINAALQVDLFDQANATRIHGRIYSGLGGSTDFLVGALHSVGGRALVTLRSWHDATDTSTIVGKLDEPTTHLQHSAVVTENGVARVFGLDERSQALALINDAAHPRARDRLLVEAERLGLLG